MTAEAIEKGGDYEEAPVPHAFHRDNTKPVFDIVRSDQNATFNL